LALSHHSVDFDGKTLRNSARFARLLTAGGMRPYKTLVFLAFFSLNRDKSLLGRFLRQSLKFLIITWFLYLGYRL
jgi:hypothetical protein